MPTRSVAWRDSSLEELADYYREEIQPQFTKTDSDRPYPTWGWLADNGYRGLADGVKQHDKTLTEFFTDDLGFPTPTTTFDWGFSNQETQTQFESYLDSVVSRGGVSTTTMKSKRSRLAAYARHFEAEHGDADLVAEAQSDQEADAFQNAMAVFDRLDTELSTDASKLMYHSEVKQFYEYLRRWRLANHNPVDGVETEFRWSPETRDNQSVSATDVGALVEATTTLEDRVMIVALAGWGLRPSEVAALHKSQLHAFPDGDAENPDPFLVFDTDRKNGPGTVALLYGVPLVETYLHSLRLEDDSWNGYLFPSNRSTTGHLATRTIQNRFPRIATDADVTVSGETPTPKMCRRFWYQVYREAVQTVDSQLDAIADEQGSASATVVKQNYIDEQARRQARRDQMKNALANAFEGHIQ